MESLAAMFRLSAQAKALEFEVLIDGESVVHVVADEGKMRQVLINLLANAIKFTPRGRIKLHVTLRRANAYQLWMSAQVEDTGTGITDQEQARLFQPFNQFKRGLTALEGTGLGLAIARSYARLMGGDITVTSSPGAGSIFRFEIPLEAGEEEDAPHPMIGFPRETLLRAQPPVLPVVSPQRLVKLPPVLIDQLLDAVQEGDKDRLDQLIQRVEECSQQSARALRGFADNYEYDALTSLLAETKRDLRQ
jgi:anti-sigma regulatory factor (Ser/Thr protein kinase)